MATARRRFPFSVLLGCSLASGLLGIALGARLSAKKFPHAESAEKIDREAHAGFAEKKSASLTLPPASSELEWARCTNQPASLARDEQMARVLEILATDDPARALSLALGQSNLALRQNLLSAVLRGWARRSPQDAAHWVLQRPPGERTLAAAAVLEGAAIQPAIAIQLAADFVRHDPALAHDHGCSLIFALTRRGEFETAKSFALAGNAANREAWLDTAFTLWAERQPENAVTAATAMPNAEERNAALQSIIAGWANTDPRGLAEFALRSPTDPTRNAAMHSGLTAWANQDPVAVSAWINQLEPNALFDPGVAAIALQSPLIAFHPEIATSWAESIFNPELRTRTLASVVTEWAKTDRAAARRYTEISPSLATERPAILAGLESQSDN